MSPIVAPSILSADFADLKNVIKVVEKAQADWVHVDVMDGAFVPNITVGPVVIKSIRKYTNLPLDVHLMIEKPERYLDDFASAGANILTVHPEACYHLHRTLTAIKALGIKAGVALNPATPLESVEHILDQVDLILIMTVNPGFGGQQFIHSMLKKIEKTRQIVKESGYKIHVEVDGGINLETAQLVCKAGANVLVAGNSIFNSDKPELRIKELKGLG